MKTEKIIGYKAPKNLFQGLIPTGTVYVTSEPYCVYWPENSTVNNNLQCLPKEIVETWEPVYEEDYKIGDYIFYLDDLSYAKAEMVAKIENIDYLDGKLWLYVFHNSSDSFRLDTYRNIIRKATPEEIEAAQIIKLTVGSKNTEVLIRKCGIEVRSKWLEVSVLREIKTQYKAIHNIGGWPVIPDWDTRFILIGCSAENNLFSLNEINRVLEAYDKLNP